MDSGEHYGLGAPVTEGDWAGWFRSTEREPFEEFAGPFYAKRESDGGIVCGFRLQPQHMNSVGSAHGGALMTFADHSLFLIAADHLGGLDSVTVTLNGEFVGGAPAGARLIARGDVVRAGGSLLFVRGLIDAAGEPVLSFSGVIKKIRRISNAAGVPESGEAP